FREIPKIDRAYFAKTPLGFEEKKTLWELRELGRDIRRILGASDPSAKILIRNCKEYEKVVRMLQARGTGDFYKYSKELYGSAQDTFSDGETTIAEMGKLLDEILSSLNEESRVRS